MSFVHLNVHTDFTTEGERVGFARIEDLVKAAVSMNMTAIAITDENCMSHYDAALFDGPSIKIIYGLDFKQDGCSLILLAQNADGLQKIRRAHTTGILDANMSGVIALSGAVDGVLMSDMDSLSDDQIVDRIKYYEKMFAGNFYIEFQSHDNTPDQKVQYRRLYKIVRAYDFKSVVTNGVLYVAPQDAKYWRMRYAIAHKKKGLREIETFSPTYYLRDSQEMEKLFGAILQDGLDNSVKIADSCDRIPFPTPPPFMIPTLEKQVDFKKFVYTRAKNRGITIDEEYGLRLEYEMSVIEEMGFSDYFVMVCEITDYLREQNILWNVRGSASSSLVAFVLGITSINPLEWDNLSFERFLNPERVTIPDIDIDVPDTKREQLLLHLKEKFGERRVAQIMTVATFGDRAAIRYSASQLGIPARSVERLLSSVGDLTSVDTHGSEVLEYAQNLCGHASHFSKNAAGVVLGDRDLEQLAALTPSSPLPLMQCTRVDDSGIAKLDVLGLKTLTALEYALEITGLSYDKIDIWDKKTYEMLQRGETDGVFQLESAGMIDTLIAVQPSTPDELTDVISLYRPGPKQFIPLYVSVKRGDAPPVYLVEEIKQVLEKTYGVCVYQEQVMMIVRLLAGYSLAEADILRRVIAKKKSSAEQERKFKEAVTRKYDERIANQVWDTIADFAQYGFNRAHALNYAILTLKMAYIKCHYPYEFWVARLRTISDFSKAAEAIRSIANSGLDVRPPSINLSEEFAAIKIIDGSKCIVLGFCNIKGVGLAASRKIIESRSNKPFANLQDFISRAKPSRSTVTNLIKSGALDELVESGTARKNLIGAMDAIASGNLTIKRGYQPVPDALVATYEMETLGYIFSEHPMKGVEERCIKSGKVTNHLRDVAKIAGGTVCGYVSRIHIHTTRKGDKMAFVTLSSVGVNAQEVIVFPNVWESCNALKEGDIIITSGRTDESCKWIAASVMLYEKTSE